MKKERIKERNEKWISENNAEEWMARSISNLELVKSAPDSEKIRYEDRCYLCSRSVEYSLKTVMILKLGKYKHGHVLGDLIDELEKNGIAIPDEIKNAVLQEYTYDKRLFPFKFPFSFGAKTSLTENTLKTRYPDNYPPITKKGYENALNKADVVVTWVNQQFQDQKNSISK
ncbi:MAG: HEPN domain-containing protein [Methanoregula sp.]